MAEVETPREPVTDTYHGVEVTDDYRWLEDGSSERTRAWTAAQDARTRAYLASVPQREPIRRRFTEILTAESTEHSHLHGCGTRFFALRKQPPRQQPFLVVLTDLDDVSGGRVLVDPTPSTRPARRPSTGSFPRPTARAWPSRSRRTAPRTAPSTCTTWGPASRSTC